MAVLSYLMFEIYLQIARDKWTSYESTIITDYHIELQTQSDPLLDMMWKFSKLETNHPTIDIRNGFSCQHKNCDKTEAEHFDDEYPKWQVYHVIPATEELNDQLTEGYEKYALMKGDICVRNRIFYTLYDYPNFLDFREKLQSLVNVQNRVRV